MLCNFSYLFPKLVYLKTLMRECLYLITHGGGSFVWRAHCRVLWWWSPLLCHCTLAGSLVGVYQLYKDFVVLLRLFGTASNQSTTLFFPAPIQALSTSGLRKRCLSGAFAKLQEVTIRFVCLSVCPSARMKQLGAHRADFHEILYLNIFRNSVEKIQLSLKSDRNSRYFTGRPKCSFEHISLSSP